MGTLRSPLPAKFSPSALWRDRVLPAQLTHRHSVSPTRLLRQEQQRCSLFEARSESGLNQPRLTQADLISRSPVTAVLKGRKVALELGWHFSIIGFGVLPI